MTNTPHTPPTFEQTLSSFLGSLAGSNRSAATIMAYRTDLQQLVTFLRDNNLTIQSPADVTKADLTEYLAHLGTRGLSGVTRARKLAAIREYFRFLVEQGLCSASRRWGWPPPRRSDRGEPPCARRSTPSSCPWQAATRGTLPSCRCFSRPASG